MKRIEDLELKLIKSLLKKSKEDYPFLEKQILNTNVKINSQKIKDLTNINRSTTISCLNEYIFEPNKKMYSLTDFELIFINDKDKKVIENLDIASTIYNKIKKREEIKRKIFEDRYKTINKILNSKKVFYSNNGNEVYKIGLETKNNFGLKFEVSSLSSLKTFDIGILDRGCFKKETTPKNLLNLMINSKKSFNENEKRLMELLNKTCT